MSKYCKVLPNDTFCERVMANSTNIPVAIKIDVSLKARLKQLADARNRTPHWMMREAISEYVEREEKRESFHQDALRAWQDYQATGLHVTQEQADAWLSALEAGQDVEPPAGQI